jgi:peptidyl-prolyl cis-trans isomerase SurA
VEEMTVPAARVLERQYPGQNDVIQKKLAQAERDNLEQLTQRQLILQDFKTAGYSLPESILDEMVQERIRSRFGNRRSMAKTLQAEGITTEKFRERLREQFIVEAMRSKNISQEIIVSPHKVENYYKANLEKFKVEDQVKLRMIVLNKTSVPSGSDAKKLADEIATKLKEGATFAEMAALYSQRSQKGATGEWYEKSQLRKELADGIATVKAGECSGVIEMTDACYLVQVEEAKESHYKPLSDVREEIEHNLTMDERARLEKQWVDRLEKKTFVKRFLP